MRAVLMLLLLLAACAGGGGGASGPYIGGSVGVGTQGDSRLR
jgi:hypothetical protein